MNNLMKVICIKENKIREEIKVGAIYFVDRMSIAVNGGITAGCVYGKIASTFFKIGIMSLEYFKTIE